MVYFLSDSHIGSRAMGDSVQHQEKVAGLFRLMQKDATEIYLLGDIFDFWCEYVWEKPQGYDIILDTLLDLTRSGIQVHYFIGNHDIWTFGWLEKRTGVKVYRDKQEMTINGKTCLLAHGDGLVPSDMMQRYPEHIRRKIRRFQFLRRCFHNPFLQTILRLMPPAWGNHLGYEWARKSRLKELAHPCPYKGEQNEELVGYAKEQETIQHHDYYIFGHRHIELDLQLSTGSRVIILGDMFKQWTYAQMDEKGIITLMNYE